MPNCRCFSYWLCDEHLAIERGMIELPELLKEAERDWQRGDREDLAGTLSRLIEAATKIVEASDRLGY